MKKTQKEKVRQNCYMVSFLQQYSSDYPDYHLDKLHGSLLCKIFLEKDYMKFGKMPYLIGQLSLKCLNRLMDLSHKLPRRLPVHQKQGFHQKTEKEIQTLYSQPQ